MKKIQNTMITSLIVIISLILVYLLFMQSPMFGKTPSGNTLSKIETSPNYKDGAFQNQMPTPMMVEDVSYWAMTMEFFTKKVKEPMDSIPTKKIDLHKLNPKENTVVWLGHSSYFMQLDGKTMLVDPVMRGHASPFSFSVKAYEGSDVYSTDDMPEIDYVFITHDHWDHLDSKTLKKLQPKIKNLICPLGNGEHLKHWGFDESIIFEGDWYNSIELDSGFTAHICPTRHFSGRTFKRNQALWGSFALLTPTTKVYMGGDSGYGEHFKEIGAKYGPFDIAFLENGQYDEKWPYIHMMPHQVLLAAKDLNTQRFIPGHSGKFTLANHDWNTPLSTITQLPNEDSIRIVTPMIGERINLNDSTQSFSKWWEL